MESWENGREKLLTEVARLYDAVGREVQTELDEVNTVRIWRSQLALLEEQAATAKNVEDDRARLASELSAAKSVIEKVDALEQSNKDLRQELETLLQNQKNPFLKDATTPSSRLDPAPTSSAVNPASTIPIPNEEPKVHTKTVPGEVYNRLARKYNELAENWKHEKRKKEEHISKYKKSKDVVAQWQALAERRAKQVERRDGIIESLRNRLDQSIQHEEETRTHDGKELLDSGMGRITANRPWGQDPPPSSGPPVIARRQGVQALDNLEIPRNEVALPPKTADMSNRPVPSLSTTTTMDLASDPPEMRQNQECPPVQFNNRDYHGATINDSEDESEPQSPILLPTLPVSRDILSLDGIGIVKATVSEDAVRPAETPQNRNVLEHPHVPRSDSPEVVSVKRVKKRRNGKESQSKSPRKRVKIEITSSPTGLARLVNSSDSLDLDDIGPKTDTPKKQQRLRDLARGRRALSDDTQSPRTESQRLELNRLRAVSEQIALETPVRQAKASRKNSALQPKSANKQVFPRPARDKTVKPSRIVSDRDIGNLVEGGEISTTILEAGQKNSEVGGRLQHLLDQTSPAKVILSPARLQSIVQRSPPKAASSRLSIYNDVDQASAQVQQTLSRATGSDRESMPAATGSSRADDLGLSGNLNTPQNEKRPTVLNAEIPRMNLSKQSADWTIPAPARATPLQINKIRAPTPEFATSSTKVTPRPSTKPVHKPQQRPLRGPQTEEDWQHDPDQEPLRLRPLESLRLEDFKINPNYNQGYNYAFGEVVRDRDTRQELQGCMKPGCCLEKFRAMALAQLGDPRVPRTAAQQEADQELLEEHMGDNVYKLRNMDQTEKNEVLLQARIRKIANQHGKHRHAYERPSTPPGFWRSDWPTTQENEADKAQAREDYKIQVKQRYDDAMRGNGRYIFKDE